MFIRQLKYLVTLSKTRHFARAAELCHVSQPALSTAIRHLEQELGIAIVQRGQRFEGFTPEGERVLVWARQLLADWESLRQDASTSRRELTGELRIGSIPTTISTVPHLSLLFHAAFPQVRQVVDSMPSETVLRRLENFDLDLGITYIEEERLEGFRVLPLYRERYLLIASREQGLPAPVVSWKEAATLPLCLLTPDMQNRRIVDSAFRRAGAEANVVVETGSILALYAFVRQGPIYSIVPHSLLYFSGLQGEFAAAPLAPELSRQIGLVAVERDPLSPLIAEAWAIAERLDLQSRLETLISDAYRQIPANNC